MRRTPTTPKKRASAKSSASRTAKKRLPNDTKPSEAKAAKSSAGAKARPTHDKRNEKSPRVGRDGTTNGEGTTESRLGSTRGAFAEGERLPPPHAAKDEEFEDLDEEDATEGDGEGDLADEDEDDDEDDLLGDDDEIDDTDLLVFDDDELEELESRTDGDPGWNRARGGSKDGREIRYFEFGEIVVEREAD